VPALAWPSLPVRTVPLTGVSRAEMIYDKQKLLELGGTHAGVQKWKHKLEV